MPLRALKIYRSSLRKSYLLISPVAISKSGADLSSVVIFVVLISSWRLELSSTLVAWPILVHVPPCLRKAPRSVPWWTQNSPDRDVTAPQAVSSPRREPWALILLRERVRPSCAPKAPGTLRSQSPFDGSAPRQCEPDSQTHRHRIDRLAL